MIREKAKRGLIDNETFWMGTFACGGYPLHVMSRSRLGVEVALLAEYRKQRGKLLSRETDFKTFAEVSDYFGCWVFEAKLDEVVWP